MSEIDTSAEAVERLANHAHKLLMGTTLGDPVPATLRALAAERDAANLALHHGHDAINAVRAERDALKSAHLDLLDKFLSAWTNGDAARAEIDILAKGVTSYEEELDAARAEAARLRDALAPFVAEAERIAPDVTKGVIGDKCQIWQCGGYDITRSRITYGDLRSARAEGCRP
jgi:hypothetical protein